MKRLKLVLKMINLDVEIDKITVVYIFYIFFIKINNIFSYIFLKIY